MRYRPVVASLLALAFAYAHADAPAPVAPPSPEQAAEPTSTPDQIDLRDIRAFTAVYSLIKQAYVEKVDDRRLMQGAIRGMLAGLDPHSQYLDREQLEDLTEDTTGSYAGLGIEVLQVDGTLRVIAPIDDTPAQRAGIKPGDIILRIDATPVQSDDLDAAVQRLRGAPGSVVTLSILHEGQSVPVDMTMKREVIKVASVRGRMLEAGYAYLRVSQFQAETGSDLRRVIERLQKAAPVKGAVLDLRSNPGGLLTSAVEVSDDFLASGIIVTTRGRIKEAEMSFRATPGGDLLNGAPLVVLVDNGTASAAEIVAGALKDNHRALLMGRRTFGKGSVQTVLPLDADHAVKLTTARYYTPSGISIQAEGIQPDIVLADLTLAPRDTPPTLMITERDLTNHLQGSSETARAAAATPDKQLEKDYALNEALNVLKGLALRHPAPVAKKE